MIAVILVRGMIGADREVRETLTRLGVTRKNSIVFLEDTPSVRGMLEKARAYVTYGPVSDELVKRVVEARGEPCAELKPRFPGMRSKKTPCKEYAGKRVKPAVRLAPPRGGWERKGVKKPYSMGGALGPRPQEAMEALINRMLPEE